MRRAIQLILALSAVAVALSSGPRTVSAAPQICSGCKPSIGGSCSRVSCDPCCYRCPGSPILLCE